MLLFSGPRKPRSPDPLPLPRRRRRALVSYTPALTDPQVIEVAPEQVNLHPLQEVDWQKMKPHPDEIFFWLDRYFLRRELYHPTTERMEKDFGANSHALQTATAMLTPLWRQLKEQNPFAVIFAEWERYLRIVYGSKVSSDDLFIRHTYLATLAKLMAWMAITGSDELPPDEKMVELLGGQIFKTQGIENFLEEDFFSWTARLPRRKRSSWYCPASIAFCKIT